MEQAAHTLMLNGAAYSIFQLISEEIPVHSEFERSTISFCQQWVKGNSSFVLKTSGSTGEPKTIELRREQMISSAQKTAQALGLDAGMNALVCLDTKYIAGQMMLVRCFVTGMNIIAIEPTANPLLDLPSEIKIDFTALVPYQLQSIINQSSERLSTIDRALVGGAPVNAQLAKQLRDVRCGLYATYGMTETISHIALKKLNHPVQKYFEALPGVNLSTDTRGCLVIDTDFLDERIITNDLVELIGDREFNWLGRWDNVINSGGVKIIPEKIEREIELILRSMEIYNRFFVSGFPDIQLGMKVCLIIEGKNFTPDKLGKVMMKLKSTLTKYEVPREILFTEKFIETGSGKVNRLKTSNLFPV